VMHSTCREGRPGVAGRDQATLPRTTGHACETIEQ
jgi:hypothetical protein